MNNKILGTAFENRMCDELADAGYWVHFITPDKRGSQPFDIIAVKDNVPVAIDCKTSVKKIFPITRLEDNQRLAFDKWVRCGNQFATVAVEYKDQIFWIPYITLKEVKKINLEDSDAVYRWK